MMRRVLTVVGAGVAVVGLLAALAALALPWARYRVSPARRSDVARTGELSVFEVDRGTWYLTALVALAALAVAVGVAGRRFRQVAGMAAPVVGLIAAAIVISILQAATGTSVINPSGPGRIQATVESAAGAGFGLTAAALLGFGAGLLSIGRAGR